MVRRRTEMWLMLSVSIGSIAVLGSAVYAQEIFAGGYRQQTGQEIYEGICQGCHMPNAKGAVGAGAYPALAGNARLAVAIYPITVLIHGKRAMPPFGVDLSDEQIANVINYVRTHFGNSYTDTITAAEVKAARP